MNYIEAYKYLNQAEILSLVKGHSKDSDAIDMALLAIEKQIPNATWISVASDVSGMTDTFRCSACGGHVYIRYSDDRCEYEYCPNCGQRMNEE